MSRRIPVLLYHRVGPRDGSFMDKYTVSPEVFAAQMELIRRHGWQPIALESMLRSKSVWRNQRSLVITFDDGFASNREHAWPVLERYAYPSATFVVTACMGRFNTWDGPSRATYLLLSPDDIAAANPEFMTFHSHSETHPHLTLMVHDTKAMRQELTHSRRCLDSMVAAPGPVFAYPFGCWNWRVVEEVRSAGYIGACNCMEGLNSARANHYLLRRVEIRERDTGWRFSLKLCIGRDILRWPPTLPLELAAEWLRRNRRDKD